MRLPRYLAARENLFHYLFGAVRVETIHILSDNRSGLVHPVYLERRIIWQSLADRLFLTLETKLTSTQQSGFFKLVEKLFLGVHWEPDTRDWLPLEGEAGRLEKLFATFGPHWVVVESYLVYLRRPGAKRLLPQAFLALTEKNSAVSTIQVLKPRSVACLEEILGHFIYSDPTVLKTTPEMRAAVLALLNACIEVGSSECYRQRDDFLTPGPIS